MLRRFSIVSFQITIAGRILISSGSEEKTETIEMKSRDDIYEIIYQRQC